MKTSLEIGKAEKEIKDIEKKINRMKEEYFATAPEI